MAVKDIISQHQCAAATVDKFFSQHKRLRDSLRPELHLISQTDAILAPIAQDALKSGNVFLRRNHQNVADTGQHQRTQRVIDHRLVVNRKQTFPHSLRHGIKPRARTSRQNDAFISRAFYHDLF